MKTLFKTLGVLGLFFFLLGNVGWGQQTYTWTGAADTDWGNASNWSPSRTTVDPSDVLAFQDGKTTTIINVPDEEICQMGITGYTSITLMSVSDVGQQLY